MILDIYLIFKNWPQEINKKMNKTITDVVDNCALILKSENYPKLLNLKKFKNKIDNTLYNIQDKNNFETVRISDDNNFWRINFNLFDIELDLIFNLNFCGQYKQLLEKCPHLVLYLEHNSDLLKKEISFPIYCKLLFTFLEENIIHPIIIDRKIKFKDRNFEGLLSFLTLINNFYLINSELEIDFKNILNNFIKSKDIRTKIFRDKNLFKKIKEIVDSQLDVRTLRFFPKEFYSNLLEEIEQKFYNLEHYLYSNYDLILLYEFIYIGTLLIEKRNIDKKLCIKQYVKP
jgi:hypothetical protein